MENKINIMKTKKNKSIVIVLSILVNFVYTILNYFYSSENSQEVQNTEKMTQELDSMEKISVYFGNAVSAEQKSVYEKALEKIKNIDSKSPEIIRRIIGLKYRLEGANGGLDKERITSQQMDTLLEIAALWIKKQKVVNQYTNTVLRQILHDVGNYPKFVELLLSEISLQDSFFSWVIRDNNSAPIFIEYPSLHKKLVESNLNIRIGHFKRPGLNIRYIELKDSTIMKTVTMLIEGKEVSIIDGQHEVQFRGNMVLTIDNIFDVFKSKNFSCGNLEYMEEGVMNWNVFEWGYWDADQNKLICIDFDRKNWWSNLPVFRKISTDDASRELGHSLDGKNWGLAACASRNHTNMNLFGNHAFIEVYFPTPDSLGYTSLPLGKYAKTVPSTFSSLEGLSMLCDMTPATISFIDENTFYTFREHAQYSLLMTPDEGERFFDVVKKDFALGKEGHFVYQIETENCAKWVQETMVTVLGEERVPNLFKTFFLETEAEGGLGLIMTALRMFPKSWQPWLVTRLHLPLGAFKGSWIERHGMRHWISLMTVSFWENGMIYFPAFLHHQLDKGHLHLRQAKEAVQASIHSFFTDLKELLQKMYCESLSIEVFFGGVVKNQRINS